MKSICCWSMIATSGGHNGIGILDCWEQACEIYMLLVKSNEKTITYNIYILLCVDSTIHEKYQRIWYYIYIYMILVLIFSILSLFFQYQMVGWILFLPSCQKQPILMTCCDPLWPRFWSSLRPLSQRVAWKVGIDGGFNHWPSWEKPVVNSGEWMVNNG